MDNRPTLNCNYTLSGLTYTVRSRCIDLTWTGRRLVKDSAPQPIWVLMVSVLFCSLSLTFPANFRQQFGLN